MSVAFVQMDLALAVQTPSELVDWILKILLIQKKDCHFVALTLSSMYLFHLKFGLYCDTLKNC